MSQACATKACSPSLQAILGGATTTIVQGRLGLTVGETLLRDTDVSLTGAYFVYSQDPLTAGYYGLSTLGRSSTRFGGGLPLAPVRWSVELDGAHRFGAFELSISMQYARYVSDQGHNAVAGLQGKYAFSSHFALWLRANVQRDFEGADASATTASASLGASYSF